MLLCRKFKNRIFIRVIAVVCMISCLSISVSAYSTTTTGATTISPTSNDFKNAKNPKYSSTSHKIYDSISSAYEMDIIHYEAQHDGYYAIYTTGSTDTVGKVFEHQNFLLWTTDYLDRGSNDDGGIGLNYRLVLDLDKNEDYYICTRAYSEKTGDYCLVVEPNDDARQSNVGGKWVSDTASYGAIATGGAYEVFDKTYMTADQVKIYYQLLRNEATQALIRNSYVRNGIVGTIQELVNAGFMGLDLFAIVDSFSPEPIIGPVSSLLIYLTEGIAETIFDSFYEDVDSIADIMAALQTYGGAGYRMENGRDVYYATSGVCVSYRGMSIPYSVGNSVQYMVDFSNLYYTYNSTKLVGEAYEKGHWE